MKKMYSLIVLFTIVLLSSCAKDEVNPFGNIYGVVLDNGTSEPIQGARVTLTPTGKSTVTGNDGSYEFVDLEAGQYKVTVQANGYSSTLKNVTVVAGEKAIGDVSLSAKPQNTKLGVDKDIVNFTKEISSNTINIQNLGNAGDIDWEITDIPSWLDVSPVKGSTGVGKSSAVTLKLNNTFTGKANCNITINTSGESVSIFIDADETAEGGNTDGDGDEETSDDYSSATVTSCDLDIEVKITSCKRSGSNVVFKYFVINNKPEDINNFRLDVKFGYGQAIISDDLGNQYTYQNMNIMFANKTPIVNSFDVVLLKGTKTNGEITIKNVPENAKNLTIKIPAESYNQYNFLNDYMKFENVPIY